VPLAPLQWRLLTAAVDNKWLSLCKELQGTHIITWLSCTWCTTQQQYRQSMDVSGTPGVDAAHFVLHLCTVPDATWRTFADVLQVNDLGQ
jgi:predicted metal-binding protein